MIVYNTISTLLILLQVRGRGDFDYVVDEDYERLTFMDIITTILGIFIILCIWGLFLKAVGNIQNKSIEKQEKEKAKAEAEEKAIQEMIANFGNWEKKE